MCIIDRWTNIISWFRQKGIKKWLSLKYAFYGSGKTKQKMKVAVTKIQPGGSDKKEIKKKMLPLKYNYHSGKMNEKCKLLLLKCS